MAPVSGNQCRPPFDILVPHCASKQPRAGRPVMCRGRAAKRQAKARGDGFCYCSLSLRKLGKLSCCTCIHLIIYPSLFLGCHGIIIPKPLPLPNLQVQVSPVSPPPGLSAHTTQLIAASVSQSRIVTVSQQHRSVSSFDPQHLRHGLRETHPQPETDISSRSRGIHSTAFTSLIVVKRRRLDSSNSCLSPSRRFRYYLGLPHWPHAASFHSSLPFERDHLRLFYLITRQYPRLLFPYSHPSVPVQARRVSILFTIIPLSLSLSTTAWIRPPHSLLLCCEFVLFEHYNCFRLSLSLSLHLARSLHRFGAPVWSCVCRSLSFNLALFIHFSQPKNNKNQPLSFCPFFLLNCTF